MLHKVLVSRFVGVLAMALAIGLPSVAVGQGAVERARLLEARQALSKPDGDGPFPAVILVAGCQGFDHPQFRGRYERLARELPALGFVAVRADYLAAAGASTCDLIMDPPAAARDILAVARQLRTLPFVKADAINVIGWSYGAGLALGTLSELTPGEPSPVAAVVAYTPYLAMARPWSVDVPVLVMCTLQDTAAPCERIDALVAELPGRDRLKYVKFLEGLHSFDNADLPPYTTAIGNGNPMGYHAATAAAAWAEVVAFLRR